VSTRVYNNIYNSKKMTSLFIGNLPWTTTSEELSGMYGPYNCTNAEVVFGKNGRSRGYGIVDFSNESDANQAIESTNGSSIGDREIVVRLDRGKTESTRNNAAAEDYNFTGCSLYVSNLPWATTGDDLSKLFANSTEAMVQMDKKGRSRGWGTVKFNSPEDATAGMEAMQGTEVEGRALSIRVDRRS
jgi:RNA recognition motif-containing protein